MNFSAFLRNKVIFDKKVLKRNEVILMDIQNKKYLILFIYCHLVKTELIETTYFSKELISQNKYVSF